MSDHNTSLNLNAINQEFKETETEKKAQSMGIPYVNLLQVRIAPETLFLVDEIDSKKAYLVVFFQIGKKIRVAVSDPDNFHAQNIIKKFKSEMYAVNINLASKESISKAQEGYSSSTIGKEEKPIMIEKEEVSQQEALSTFSESAKQIKTESTEDILSHFYTLAVQTNTSDIHIQAKEKECIIRFRIDGVLQTISSIDDSTKIAIIKHIKFKAHLNLNTSNAAQDGQYFIHINDRKIDMRVSVIPSMYGEVLTLRLLDPKKGIVPLADLGFKKYSLEKMAVVLSKPEGMILLTGPTGSGKTTTLYSLLDVLNRPYRKIITLEDPVEYSLEGIVQCNVSREGGNGTLSFEEALIASLRQDPDVIMLGEIREPKVAGIAMQAALTGHMVLSTLHTNSAIESLLRLMQLGIPSYLIGGSVNALIAQRLVRVLCPHCKVQEEWKAEQRAYVYKTAESLRARGAFLNEIPEYSYTSKGCPQCNNTGFKGRMTVAEVLIMSSNMRSLIEEKADERILLLKATEEGFINMKEDAFLKVLEGLTSFDEVYRILG